MWTDNLHQGYVRLVLRPGNGEASYIAVNTVKNQDYAVETLRRFALVRQAGSVRLKG